MATSYVEHLTLNLVRARLSVNMRVSKFISIVRVGDVLSDSRPASAWWVAGIVSKHTAAPDAVCC